MGLFEYATQERTNMVFATETSTTTFDIPVATTVGELVTTMTDDDRIIAEGRESLAEIERINSELAPVFKKTREHWNRVGKALLVGRRLHPANIAFSRWCKDNGFGGISPSVRSNAMWLTQNWGAVLHSIQDGDCHPTNIRAAYNAHINGTADADDEDDIDTADTPEPVEPVGSPTKAIEGPKEDPVEAEIVEEEPVEAEVEAEAEVEEPVEAEADEDDTPVEAETVAPWEDDEDADTTDDVDETSEDGVGIFDNKVPEDLRLGRRAISLLDIRVDDSKIGGVFRVDEVFEKFHPEAMVEMARVALIDSIKNGDDPETAVQNGALAVQKYEEDIIAKFTAFIRDVGMEGRKQYYKRARANKLLKTDDRKVSALFAHAFSQSNTLPEREKAIETLEKMKNG